jgi:hypothetical protein
MLFTVYAGICFDTQYSNLLVWGGFFGIIEATVDFHKFLAL